LASTAALQVLRFCRLSSASLCLSLTNMGNVSLCKESTAVESPTKVKNQAVAGKGGVLQLPAGCKVRVCVVAYDYHGYGADAATTPRLACVRDGVRFAKMAKDAGAAVVCEYYDRPNLNQEGDQKRSLGFPSKKRVLDQMRAIGSETTENDAFIFYFAGHGISKAREVEEGQEEMMVFMEETGRPSYLLEAEVAAVLSEAFPKEAHVLFVTDCFHNGNFCDLSWPTLAGRPIVHIGCVKDAKHIPASNPPESFKEVPSPFTASILDAVEHIGAAGSQDVSVVQLYNKALEIYDARLEGEEKPEVAFDRTISFDPDTFRWPLVPVPGWTVNDPLDEAQQQQGLSAFACVR